MKLNNNKPFKQVTAYTDETPVIASNHSVPLTQTNMKEMEKLKKKMIEFVDFHGGTLLDVYDVNKCETKEQLHQIIEAHSRHLESVASDAQSHLERFQRELGLTRYQLEE